jgi:predicted methyltransferase
MRARIAAAVLLTLATPPIAAAQSRDHSTSGEATQVTLQTLIASDDRPDNHRARDRYRNPFQTLVFFGIEPDMTVVEIWPGGQGGFYRRLLEPLISGGGGRYIPVDDNSAFPGTVPGLPYGEVDLVLVFRAHGFMIYQHPAQDYVDAIYTMLRPGGIFGIVDHAGDESVPQDPTGANGYVNESHFLAMAETAGFELIAASDINRNPRDTKDHPQGVYSLPPTLAGTLPFTSARQRFLDIGESDRFTLKFVKP